MGVVRGRYSLPLTLINKELAYITHAWSAYVEYAKRYRAEGRKPYSSV